tara:strand:+ start:339 stop:554 length:216 start_codon:yes stop_codon:yes gene_type:complete
MKLRAYFFGERSTGKITCCDAINRGIEEVGNVSLKAFEKRITYRVKIRWFAQRRFDHYLYTIPDIKTNSTA